MTAKEQRLLTHIQKRVAGIKRYGTFGKARLIKCVRLSPSYFRVWCVGESVMLDDGNLLPLVGTEEQAVSALFDLCREDLT